LHPLIRSAGKSGLTKACRRPVLRPGPAVNEIILGVLGRAQRLYPVRCCSVVFMSNHWHALLEVDDALQLARFMQHVDGNLSGEIGRSKRAWSTE